MTKIERKVILWLMQGYTGTDIAEHCGTHKQNIAILLSRAVEKIVNENNKKWMMTYAESRGI